MRKIFSLFLLIILTLTFVSCEGTKTTVDEPPVIADKDEFTFGKYPQNEIFNQSIISELSVMEPNSNGYLVYNEIEYMELNGRYFEVSPIIWKKILVNGKIMYLADKILDQVQYLSLDYFEVCIYPYSSKPGTPEGIFANDYQYSDVREFLNGIFFDVAFSSEEKSQLEKISYDGLSDYIYTLSVNEINEEMPLATSATAYAVACGCEQIYDTEKEENNQFNGNSTWWLRTPNLVQLWRSAGISYEGMVFEFIDCHNNKVGIRPVICLK